jgi:hypothetical protein
MGNDIRKQQNDSIRKIRGTLDTLNQLVQQKTEVVEKTPELALVDKFDAQSDVAVLEDDQFAAHCEQVAALQFSSETKDTICKVVNISQNRYKEIVTSDEFVDVKRRIAEDQKTLILSKVLKQVDSAMDALAELTVHADEDKTRLNAAALVLEHAARLLEDQKVSSPSFGKALGEAAAGVVAGGGTVTLSQMIINQRASRGLSG